jgi:calpain-7
MRWRGNFSELDTTHWTERLKKELNFDPKAAAMVDNGMLKVLEQLDKKNSGVS